MSRWAEGNRRKAGQPQPHLALQFLHGDEVQGPQGVASGSDEIQAGVDSGVLVAAEGALDFQLLLEIFLKLGVEMVENGLVAVNEIAKKKKNKRTTYESCWCPGYKRCTLSRMPDFTSC